MVLAMENNPTIMNPDFLARTEIVKPEWDWRVVGQPISTPGISTVQYDSQVMMTVEPNKLQVTDSSGRGVDFNHICEIVKGYVRALPHVHYTAMGINFSKVAFPDDPSAYIIDRFLKKGTWNSETNPLTAVGYKFVYPLDNGQITYSVDSGRRKNIERPLIASQANFHRNLDPNNMPTSEQVGTILDSVQEDYAQFEQLHLDIIEHEQ